DAVVIEQPVAVAEVDDFGDRIHLRMSGFKDVRMCFGNRTVLCFRTAHQTTKSKNCQIHQQILKSPNPQVLKSRLSFSPAASTARFCWPKRRRAARSTPSTSARGWRGSRPSETRSPGCWQAAALANA